MSNAAKNRNSQIPEIIKTNERDLLKEWVKTQVEAIGRPSEFLNEAVLTPVSTEFLNAMQRALQSGHNFDSIEGQEWSEVKGMLGDISRSRALQGFSPTETALFVFSLKETLFNRLRTQLKDPKELAEETLMASKLLDLLGLYTTEVYQRSREEVIRRQQQELLELSTPVIRIWDGVLAIPIIGTLDSARTQIVMENLLEQIVQTGSKIAILDITGVPTVDTQTAQHLIKTVAAARLMGAECIISGIRPQIAQTIVHLGIEITDVITQASMADAVRYAMTKGGWVVAKRERDNAGAASFTTRA